MTGPGLGFLMERAHTPTTRGRLLLLISLAVIGGWGCHLTSCRADEFFCSSRSCFGGRLSDAEAAFDRAEYLRDEGDARCVDWYFRAAQLAWLPVQRRAAVGATGGTAHELYQTALASLITTGQETGRWSFTHGLLVHAPGGARRIPIRYHGFPWQPEQFGQLCPVHDPHVSHQINHVYRTDGLGVANIARSAGKQRFVRAHQPFAATVVLRPSANSSWSSPNMELHVYDPLRISTVQIDGRPVNLTRDLTAHLTTKEDGNRETSFMAFVQPDTSAANRGLFMLEPYQPGKIPVILVHGLLSSPSTWTNFVNEMHARPDLNDQYQIWEFQYGTGEPFLKSAAMLRDQMFQAVVSSDPDGQDQALSQIVMIGHSMGGLVSKLQVTSSGQTVWRSFANRPPEAIVAPPDVMQRLRRYAFFEPSPFVTEVIYVGTPHRGSPWAWRPVGRLAGRLVEEPSANQAAHERIVAQNPGVFTEEFSARIPTSIDLLRPDSKMLLAMDRLPMSKQVCQHSIIGSCRCMIGAGDSDGVVPVESAEHGNVASEVFVSSKHGRLNKAESSLDEMFRILRAHAQRCR
ncbi:MAG: alpha/beta fold hydrolase [Planctomycetota bacterium]